MRQITEMNEDEQMELMWGDQNLFKSLLETTANRLEDTQGLRYRADVVRLAVRFIDSATDVQGDLIAESTALYEENKDLKIQANLRETEIATLFEDNKKLRERLERAKIFLNAVY